MRTALFDSDWGPVALAIAVGCITLGATLVALARPRGAWLRSRLDPYGRLEATGSAAVGGASPGWRPTTERLFGAAERHLEDTRLWRRTMRLLERAGSQMRPAGLLYTMALTGVGTLVVVAVLTDSFGVGLLAAIGGVMAPWLWMGRAARRRSRAFDAQLPDILMGMASSLRVGLTFNHAMAAVVDDGKAPAAEEFERVLNESELGRPLEDALSAMADRIRSEDLRFVLMSVAIQREVGGSLANLFQTVSDTVRDRQHFRLKVRALTAMGRISAYVLVALPFITVALISLLSTDYIRPLFVTSAGHVMIGIALVLMVLGSFCLKKIVSIKG